MRGVLVKPLENYSFQFSARIVINFRKTYINRFHIVAIRAQLSSAKALTPSLFLAGTPTRLEPQLAKVVNGWQGLSGANGERST